MLKFCRAVKAGLYLSVVSTSDQAAGFTNAYVKSFDCWSSNMVADNI